MNASGKKFNLEDSSKIDVFDLYKVYKRDKIEVVALRGLEIHVQKGEFLIIVGPSGCGKSTLMNIIGGIDKPTAGTIFFNGKNLTEMTDDEFTIFRRNNIGFVFQFFNLLGSLNAFENVELPMISKHIPSAERRVRVDNLLKVVGLQDRRLHYPSELSGGEQQRIALASALANEPGILLADEPTGELDTHNAHEVMAIFKDLLKHFPEMSIIMVTHDLSLRKYADRIVCMRDGRIEETIKHQFESNTLLNNSRDQNDDRDRNLDFSTILLQYPYITDINNCSACKDTNIQLNVMKTNNIEKIHESFQILEVLVVCNVCHHVEKQRVKSFLG